jgi:serine/threonine protein kinase
MTQTGMVMGTPQYLSPEQALGKAVDHRSDLYATGCLLYELLALRPPFTGETPLSVVYQHVQDIPTPPSEVSDACPPELDGLVMRSLAKEPDDRFQTAEEMRGLVQYGLQMLYEQGGHTGTWNTGPVGMHEGRHTPAAGLAGTAVLPHSGDVSGTTQIPQPILPTGYGGGDDGGFEGSGNRGSGRGKLWILAVLAVIAIAAGVALALQNGNKGNGDPGTTQSPTTSKTTDDQTASETPSDDTSEDPTDTSTDDGSGTGSGSQYTPSYSPSYSPSQQVTQDPTYDPTDPQTTPEPSDPQTTPEPSDPQTTPEPSDPAAGGVTGNGGTAGDGN